MKFDDAAPSTKDTLFAIEEGTAIVSIAQPFTLREFAGPWSWLAIRYYWFVFDELALDAYVSLASRGHDPTEFLLLPALREVAGNVELILETTPLALRFVGARSGSVLLKVAGAFVALKKLFSWLPIYGKWVQSKGHIDIKTEVARSKALVEVKENFIAAGIPEEFAFRLAFERLYQTWPDFFAPGALELSSSIQLGELQNTGNTLAIGEREIRGLIPQPPAGLLSPPAEPQEAGRKPMGPKRRVRKRRRSDSR